MREGGGLDVVEAHDRNVPAWLQAGVPDGLEGGERHQVRRGEDCRRALLEREQRAGSVVAAGRGEVRLVHVLLRELEA